MKHLIVFFIVMILIIVGCRSNVPTEWTLIQQPYQIVWADDGSEVAVVLLSYEEKGDSFLSRTTQKRRFKHKIVVQNVDGSGRNDITDWRNNQSGRIFYMKQAGYFVIESLLENGSRRFDKIDQNGNEILIVETPDKTHQPCQNQTDSVAQVEQTVIPSPDGRQLVHVYSPECGKVSVEFLYANNLNVIDTQTMNINEPMNVTWHREGYVIFTNQKNDNAWKVLPLAPSLPVLPPNCISPVTTSSEISLEGQKIFFDGEELITKEVGRQKAFGCQ